MPSFLNQLLRRPRFWLLVMVLAVLLGFVGLSWLRKKPVPNPGPLPEAPDHLVAKLLKETRQQLLDDLGSGPAWGEMGMVLWANEYPDQALEHFAVAERLEPGELRWPYFQSLILIDRDPPQGLAKLRQTCALGPSSLTPRLRLAEALFSQGELAEAEEIVDPLLEEHPEHGPLWLVAGRVSLANARLDAARERFQRAARHPLTARSAGQLLAHVLHRQERPEESAQALAEADQHPENLGIPDPYWEECLVKKTGKKAFLDKIDQLLAKNNLAGAIEMAEVLAREYPDDANGHFLLGSYRLQYLNQVTGPTQRREYLEAARAALATAVKRAPHNAGYVLMLALASFEEQTETGFQQAVRLAEQALVMAPQDPKIYGNLGQMYLKKGQLEAAGAVLHRGLQVRPDAKELHDRLGQIYWLQSHFLPAYHHLLQGEIGNAYGLSRLVALANTLQCW